MKAYHNDPKIKSNILKQLKGHREADELIKGKYWENGKGCAVGCTIRSNEHKKYEERFGIPEALAHLEDAIFEGLPNAQAKLWPEKFMSSIPVGADLSRVQRKFLHWLLTDEQVNPGINSDLVKKEIDIVAGMVDRASRGQGIARSAAWSAAENARGAAENARGAAWGARSVPKSASSAAWSVSSAIWSASSAAWSAWSAVGSIAGSAAESAAKSAKSAAKSAAWSAGSAEESAAYLLMSHKLIEILKEL